MTRTSENEPEVEVIDKNKQSWKSWRKNKNQQNIIVQKNSGGGHALYLLGFIGSLVYWLQAAVGFGAVITSILKSLVWPAYIVYKLLESFYGLT